MFVNYHRSIKFFSIVLVFVSIISMGYAQNTDYMPNVRYINKNFNGLIVAGIFDVNLRYGDDQNISIMAKDYMKDNIEIKVLNRGYVVIRYKEGAKIEKRSDAPRIDIVVNNLEYLALSGECSLRSVGDFMIKNHARIDVSGASSVRGLNLYSNRNIEINFSGISHIENSNFSAMHMTVNATGVTNMAMNVECTRLDAVVSGSSAVNLSAIAATSSVNVSGASALALNIETHKLDAEASGSSNIKLSGVSQSSNINVSGSSNLDMINMNVENQYVKLTGASRVNAKVNNCATVNCSQGSSFNYTGNGVVEHNKLQGRSSRLL